MSPPSIWVVAFVAVAFAMSLPKTVSATTDNHKNRCICQKSNDVNACISAAPNQVRIEDTNYCYHGSYVDCFQFHDPLLLACLYVEGAGGATQADIFHSETIVTCHAGCTPRPAHQSPDGYHYRATTEGEDDDENDDEDDEDDNDATDGTPTTAASLVTTVTEGVDPKASTLSTSSSSSRPILAFLATITLVFTVTGSYLL